MTVFGRVGCILRAVETSGKKLENWTKLTETSRISVVRDIEDRFWGLQQLIANDIPLLTAVPFARGPYYFYYDFAVAFARRRYLKNPDFTVPFARGRH